MPNLTFANFCFTLIFTLMMSMPVHAGDITFDHYHSQESIHNYLVAQALAHPDLVKFYRLGQSLQGRDIDYVIVSIGDPKQKPAIYFNGTHHGDEWSSTESVLGLIDELITHATDPKIKAILEKYAIYLQPMVNPDGHAAQTREDSQRRDPNRDYSFPQRSDADSFQLPEIRLVKKLVDAIRPRAAAAYHSGIEEILWSWCFTKDRAPQAALLATLGQRTAEAMKMDRYLQSYDDYATDGEFIDYVYAKFATLALTFEVSQEKTPPEADLAAVVKRSITGALAMMFNVSQLDQLQSHLNTDLATRPPVQSYGHLGRAPWHQQRLE